MFTTKNRNGGGNHRDCSHGVVMSGCVYCYRRRQVQDVRRQQAQARRAVELSASRTGKLLASL